MKNYHIEYVGIDHPQYWQGASVAYTEWENVYTGVGSTPYDAAEDACENAAQSGEDTASVRYKSFSHSVPRELASAYREAGDECELQCCVLLWMRSPGYTGETEAVETRRHINASIKAYTDAYGEGSLG